MLIVLAGRGATYGFVTQAARTVCNANEYQVATVDPGEVPTSLISFDILAP